VVWVGGWSFVVLMQGEGEDEYGVRGGGGGGGFGGWEGMGRGRWEMGDGRWEMGDERLIMAF